MSDALLTNTPTMLMPEMILTALMVFFGGEVSPGEIQCRIHVLPPDKRIVFLFMADSGFRSVARIYDRFVRKHVK